MPFATARVSRGVQGNHRVVTGEWTGAVGDANGTYDVEGGVIYGCEFLSNITSGPVERVHAAPTSTRGAVPTVPVYTHQAVTAGTFRIECL